MIISHWHTAFTVSDIERSIKFYTDFLNFEVVHRQRQSNTYTREFVGYPDADLEAVMLKIKGDNNVGISGHLLELNQYYSPKGEKIDVQTCNIGSAHLALVVDDIHQTYESLIENNVIFKSSPVEIEHGRNKGGYTCYFLDPDGITLELFQPSQ
ncbi:MULTISPECIES: VOC family protein [Oceanobacillus]|uniref:VOC family protein n=1 Tax=Oceanobacillus aidingensis TaxID=645964 RepID=A0ABV9JSB8_9BACI|nr:VOC family protein [Oceanobacillus oncorhynchi]UUI39911.1 VOC family protein [Oceanobacillus oncorhynchi]